ncbi:MAG: HTH domain-containing protein [Nanoarchaeota archaeon]|nr:HTH domain-containing protein [Nanoarchaeota archaeon]
MKTAPLKREKIIRKNVLEYLKKNPRGKTTTELGKELKISRKTIEKHLQLLVFENEAYMKQFGPTRVYYPNKRLHYLDFKKINLNNKTIWFDLMENEYGKYLLIQEKREENKEFITKGSILIPLNKAKLFVNSLNKLLKENKLKELVK